MQGATHREKNQSYAAKFTLGKVPVHWSKDQLLLAFQSKQILERDHATKFLLSFAKTSNEQASKFCRVAVPSLRMFDSLSFGVLGDT
jgi:hypothetical protein